MLIICDPQVPTTTATVQMKDGQLIPAGVFEGVVDPSRVGPNGAEFSGNKNDLVCLSMCIIVCMWYSVPVICKHYCSVRHQGACCHSLKGLQYSAFVLIAFHKSLGNYITSCINCFDVVTSNRRSFT